VAIVHGSGPTTRDYDGALPAYFASRGLVVLAYDKRGTGASDGAYPGDVGDPRAVETLARDAVSAAHLLAARPEVAPRRVGLAGQSQAGWVMARAAALDHAVRWVISYSGPSTTVGEADLWGHLTGQGGAPAESLARARRDVLRAGRSGFDPIPSIRKARIPMLYLYGGHDRYQPSWLSRARLKPLRGRVTVAYFPRGDHFMVDSDRGLTTELARSSHYAKGFWSTIDAWLAKR
jgi:uncharacterized protein